MTIETGTSCGAALSAAVAPLFVPALKPRLIDKAFSSDSDAVIVDLEDSIAAEHKQTARDALDSYLETHANTSLHVRINPTAPHLDADLDLVARHPGITTIVVPKAECPDALVRIARLGRPLWPLIESPAGVIALPALVRIAGVSRLGFGGVDFANEMGLDPDNEGEQIALDHMRCQLVLHSAAAGLLPPVANPYTNFKDEDGLVHIARRARGMGFGGMLCIHPAQVKPVKKAFAPTDDQLAWAHRVIEASRINGGAFQINGQMIDAPVLARAKALIARASQQQPPDIE